MGSAASASSAAALACEPGARRKSNPLSLGARDGSACMLARQPPAFAVGVDTSITTASLWAHLLFHGGSPASHERKGGVGPDTTRIGRGGASLRSRRDARAAHARRRHRVPPAAHSAAGPAVRGSRHARCVRGGEGARVAHTQALRRTRGQHTARHHGTLSHDVPRGVSPTRAGLPSRPQRAAPAAARSAPARPRRSAAAHAAAPCPPAARAAGRAAGRSAA
jgi:hypothetical protein